MYLRPCYRRKNGKRHAYWALMEAYRTERGPRAGAGGFLRRTIPEGREKIPWSSMALVLVLCRLCNPSSELHIAEHFYAQSVLAELLGVPAEEGKQQRLYRGTDAVVRHNAA